MALTTLSLATTALVAASQTPAASAPSSRPGATGLQRQPTAEEVMQALQREEAGRRRVVPPDLPRGLARRAGNPPSEEAGLVLRSGKLLPEGYRLVDRAGRLATDAAGGPRFVFEERGKGPAEPSIRLLPSRLLEQMEAVSAESDGATVFLISGEVTEYRGENYLLVQKLLIRPNLGNLK